jgi:hypothetical protein
MSLVDGQKHAPRVNASTATFSNSLRLATTLGAFHFLAFACLMIANLFRLLT